MKKTKYLEIHKWLVISLIIIIDMSTDIYLPSIPIISSFFDVSENEVQLSVSVNLFGIAVSSLIYGSLSDYYGRKKIILAGLFVFFLSSIMCALSTSFSILLFWRFVQGLGGGVGISVGFAVIKDLYSGIKCAQIFSQITMLVEITLAISPILGSWIVLYFGWQFIFLLLSLLSGLLILLYYYNFKETLKIQPIFVKTIAFLVTEKIKLLRNKQFICYALINSFSIAVLWTNATNIPFIFIQNMKVNMKYYGLYMLITSLSYALGSFINQFSLKKGHSISFLLKIGLIIHLFSALLLITSDKLVYLTPLLVQLIRSLGAIGVAFIFSNALTLALESVPTASGAAASCISFLQILFASFLIFFITLICRPSIFSIASTTIIVSLVSFLILLYLTKQSKDRQYIQ